MKGQAVMTDSPAAQVLQRYSEWVRAWSPWVLMRWMRRHYLVTATLAVLALLLLGAARAGAEPGTGADGEGNVLISWMGIKDSDGVPVAKYTLSLNQGSWSKPAYAAFAMLALLIYEIYLCVIATALWLIKFALGLEWMRLFTTPFTTIGHGVSDAVDRLGLAPTALAVLAIIVACTALAGKTAKAFSNIAMGLLMVGLAATIFANPLAELIGPSGLIAKGRDTGMQIAATMSDGQTPGIDGQGLNADTLTASLADRFLRHPTQMINFGMVSDSISRKCEQAWSKGISAGRGDDLKDDMGACDSENGGKMHKNAMKNPTAILASLFMFEIMGAFLIAFACYYVWHVVRAAVHAMFFAMLAPPAFAVGVIPGGPQTFAWKTVLDCAMAYAAMIVYTAWFGAYNVVLDTVFKATPNAISAMFLTTLVLAFSFAFFGPLRRMFDRQRDTLAAKLGRGAASTTPLAGVAAPAKRVGAVTGKAVAVVARRVDTGTAAGANAAEGARRLSGGSAAADTAGQGSGGAGDGVAGGDVSTPVSQPAAPPAPATVTLLDRERAERAHDRLDEAIRMQRGTRAGGRTAPGSSSDVGRYSLSESA